MASEEMSFENFDDDDGRWMQPEFLYDWDKKKKKKKTLFVPPAYRCYKWNMARSDFMASEKMSFENVDDDDGQRTDGRRMPAYTISSPLSLRLRWAKKPKQTWLQ